MDRLGRPCCGGDVGDGVTTFAHINGTGQGKRCCLANVQRTDIEQASCLVVGGAGSRGATLSLIHI